MSTQLPFKNPQEIFQSFSKETTRFFESFMANQGQEMLKEFTSAWEAWTKKSATMVGISHPLPTRPMAIVDKYVKC